MPYGQMYGPPRKRQYGAQPTQGQTAGTQQQRPQQPYQGAGAQRQGQNMAQQQTPASYQTARPQQQMNRPQQTMRPNPKMSQFQGPGGQRPNARSAAMDAARNRMDNGARVPDAGADGQGRRRTGDSMPYDGPAPERNYGVFDSDKYMTHGEYQAPPEDQVKDPAMRNALVDRERPDDDGRWQRNTWREAFGNARQAAQDAAQGREASYTDPQTGEQYFSDEPGAVYNPQTGHFEKPGDKPVRAEESYEEQQARLNPPMDGAQNGHDMLWNEKDPSAYTAKYDPSTGAMEEQAARLAGMQDEGYTAQYDDNLPGIRAAAAAAANNHYTDTSEDPNAGAYDSEYLNGQMGQADSALTEALGKNGQYDDSADTNAARTRLEERQQKLAEAEAGKPGEYQSKYAQQLDQTMNGILGRKEFSYDADSDPAYQAYKKAYTNAAQQSMLNSMAAATANNGGFGSSTAQMAAQAAYAEQMNNVTNAIPQLMDQAYGRYQDDLQNRRADVNMLQGADSMDYGKYRDSVGDWQADRAYNYAAERDAMGDLQNSKSFDYARYSGDRDYSLNAAQAANNAYMQRAGMAENAFQNNRAFGLQQAQYNANIDQQNFGNQMDIGSYGMQQDQMRQGWRNQAWNNNLNAAGAAFNAAQGVVGQQQSINAQNRSNWESDREFGYRQGRDAIGDARYDREYADSRADVDWSHRRHEQEYDDSRADVKWSQDRTDRLDARDEKWHDDEFDYRTNRDYVEDERWNKQWQHQIGREQIEDKRYDQAYADSRDDTMWSRGREEKWDPWTQRGLDQDLRYNAQNAVYKQIQMGMDPTDADLAAGGMSKAHAMAMRNYLMYGGYGVGSGGSGGRGGSGGGGSNSGNIPYSTNSYNPSYSEEDIEKERERYMAGKVTEATARGLEPLFSLMDKTQSIGKTEKKTTGSKWYDDKRLR